MKTNISIAILTLFVLAVSAVQAQMGDKIGPGSYRQIGGFRLSGDETVQLTAGEERQFKPLSTVTGRAGMYREIVAPTTWSVTKADGVTIDDKGKLTVGPVAKHGAKFTITADVTIKEEWEPKGYEATVKQDVIVYDPKENPLVGDWTQKEKTTCEGKKIEVDGRDGLQSLEFRADGTYSAAISPFEVYRDYWGTYTFDAAKGMLKMTVVGGNSELTHLSTDGHYEIKGGMLSIAGMRLHPDLQYQNPCKAHFTK